MSRGSSKDDSYADGWRALQKLIHEGGSLSGHERNVFYANCGDGTFADASAVAGLDFDEDGRAFATADLDHDGDLDVVLKNRNGPQVRVLRNDAGSGRRAVAFDLGPQGVGARVRLQTQGVRRSKEAKAGSGFLSQSSPLVWFGLGEKPVFDVEVGWPSGKRSRWNALAAGGVYRLRPDTEPELEPFRSGTAREEVSVAPPPVLGYGFWTLDPPPAPDFDLSSLDGSQVRLSTRLDKPTLVNFWATWCPPCRKELADLAKVRQGDLNILAVSLDKPKDRSKVEAFSAEVGMTFPVLFGDESVASAYSLVYQQLSGARREIPLPFSVLVDGHGMIVRAYVGPIDATALGRDLRALEAARKDGVHAASPFPGRWIGARPLRDFARAAQEYLDNGLPDTARHYYERAASQRELSAREWNNLALAQGASGHEEDALRSLRRSVTVEPGFADGWQNLGLVLLRSGETKEGLQALERAKGLGHASFALFHHLGLGYALQHRTEEAIVALQEAHRQDPKQAEPLVELGALYIETDQRPNAVYVLVRAAGLESIRSLDAAQLARFRDLLSRAQSPP